VLTDPDAIAVTLIIAKRLIFKITVTNAFYVLQCDNVAVPVCLHFSISNNVCVQFSHLIFYPNCIAFSFAKRIKIKVAVTISVSF
jgi:hypothetical protein